MFFRKELTKQLQFSHSENQLLHLSFLSHTDLTYELLCLSFVSLSLRLALLRLLVFLVLEGTQSYRFLSAERNVSFLFEHFDLMYKRISGRRILSMRCSLSKVNVCLR